MAKQFDGKVALVTGGNSGIGKAAALAFAREGAKVIVAARRVPEGEAVAAEIRASGGEAIFIQADVSRESDVEAMVSKAVDAFGRLDCAFNNAGIGIGHGPLHQSTADDWDPQININLRGVWLCMKHEIVQMLRQGGGAIVNNSSTAGLAGYANNPIYAASKFGVTGLTMSTALQYATQGIRINAICPGWTITPMVDPANPDQNAQAMAETPMKRLASADEQAEAALWLCSDAASFVINFVSSGRISKTCTALVLESVLSRGTSAT